ncbi:MAG: NADPH:quinone oxidoreductase family protein [Janthinobacterium lividum]
MKAVICHAFAPLEQLDFGDIDCPVPTPTEVRIRVHAAGVSFADSLKVEGRYQVKPALPWVPGSEVSGVVIETGAQVTQLRTGDRVMGIADARAGGFAEEMVLDAARVLKLPAQMPFDQAAAMPAVYGTSFYALRQRGELKPGETLLVLGASGGVGLAAVQLGHAMGARVIAAASTPEKRALAQAHGAREAVDYTQPDWREQVKALTAGRGADVVFDPVGGDAFDEAVRCVSWLGRYLLIGFTAGRIPILKMNMPLLKGYDIRGVRYDVWRDGWWADARANLEAMLAMYAQGRIKPLISAAYPLAEAKQAIRSLTMRGHIGKVVLVND